LQSRQPAGEAQQERSRQSQLQQWVPRRDEVLGIQRLKPAAEHPTDLGELGLGLKNLGFIENV
jgi:hypothetical protein